MALYMRMLLLMGVSLYTSRVILSTLGAADYGIYNVVGGVVVLFAFLNNAMAGSTSRFLTYELGKQNGSQFKKIFSMSLCIHILLAFVIFLLAETIGMWFLVKILVIPAERMTAAHWVYQFSILACIISIIQVPYSATIIAHEQMNIFAYISILDAIFRLVIVYILDLVNYDKLIIYALCVCAVSIITTIIYQIYCKRKYTGCSISFYWEKNLCKSLITYSSWDLFGNVAVMGMGQGLNMVLNVFFGPTVNAARAISYQVEGALIRFADNFLTAVRPQIVKYYAEGNIASMMKLVFRSSKYSFFLVYFLSLPIIMETSFVLDLWLKNVPEHAARFCQLVLINSLIWVLRKPIVFSFHATGNIRSVNVVAGGILLSILPVSYLILKIGYSPESVFIVTIVVSMIAQIAELIFLKRLISYSIRAYLKQIIIRCGFVILTSATVPYLLTIYLTPGLNRFILVVTISLLMSAIAIFFIGIDKVVQQHIINKLTTISNWVLK